MKNAKAEEKKYHHYVPRLLLKNFSSNGKFLYVFNFKENKIYHGPVNKSFGEYLLNTIKRKDGGNENNFIEDLINEVFEKDVVEAFEWVKKSREEFLKDGRTGDFNWTYYLRILRFAILGHLRTPYSMTWMKRAFLVTVYASWYLEQFTKHGNLDLDHFEEKNVFFDVEKGLDSYNYLEQIDDIIQNWMTDVSVTALIIPSIEDYFILPDVGTVFDCKDPFHFAARDLKIYLPISSKVVLLFERLPEYRFPGIAQLKSEQILDINLLFLRNFRNLIGCESIEYLNNLTSTFKSSVTPLPLEESLDLKSERAQIKKEILAKFGGSPMPSNFTYNINKYLELEIFIQ